jgi:hypothetical protein
VGAHLIGALGQSHWRSLGDLQPAGFLEFSE